MARFEHLDAWLAWQEQLHPNPIELTLQRPATVWQRLGAPAPARHVITVAGTNGKGSTIAMLAAMLAAGGYRVGVYTSPHLFDYRERITVAGQPVSADALCAAFAAIDAARADISLTYFEFGTLAALQIFADAQLDVALLEVGMGGRLDAVNLIDADVAVITTIDLDHTAWLGDSREAIGFEKAGICRRNHPVVIADPAPPATLQQHATAIGAPRWQLGEQFTLRVQPEQRAWQIDYDDGTGHRALPYPALAGDFQRRNAAAAIVALDRLAATLPLDEAARATGLQQVRLPGRFETLATEPLLIRDVAHNRQATVALAENLQAVPIAGRTFAIFGALADKDLIAMVEPLQPLIAHWFIAPPGGTRSATLAQLTQALRAVGVAAEHISCAADPNSALKQAVAAAAATDRLILFGSFVMLEATAAAVSLVRNGDRAAHSSP